MLLHRALPHPSLEWQAPLLSPLGEDWLGATYWSVLEWNGIKLTSIHNFSAIILRKIFFAKEVPPFHLIGVISLIINMLYMVELWVELGWNFM